MWPQVVEIQGERMVDVHYQTLSPEQAARLGHEAILSMHLLPLGCNGAYLCRCFSLSCCLLLCCIYQIYSSLSISFRTLSLNDIYILFFFG
jgi:hypothetical protein